MEPPLTSVLTRLLSCSGDLASFERGEIGSQTVTLSRFGFVIPSLSNLVFKQNVVVRIFSVEQCLVERKIRRE